MSILGVCYIPSAQRLLIEDCVISIIYGLQLLQYSRVYLAREKNTHPCRLYRVARLSRKTRKRLTRSREDAHTANSSPKKLQSPIPNIPKCPEAPSLRKYSSKRLPTPIVRIRL